ncbi:TnsD family Tn7-like transposition protein [Clostridium sp. BSD9I1]|uniref:TnsD family Tn7-like transposition protein n=1 Tax=Clostridium sp. BSD9I1 TaxID=2003589 RepID=UPI0016472907|nr:TnsD family Tn7-like transposition protein [Clostridium sp. BSD9I1]
MLRFFPMPYPDESIYSVFVRYDKMTGNNNYFITIKELMGDMYATVTYTLANRLDFLCSELPKCAEYTPELFIENNMILPFYKPFIPLNRYEKAIKNIKQGQLTSVKSSLGMTAGSIFKTIGINYCPQCIAHDRKTYGEAYLHRIHQLEGNFICVKHKCLLETFEPEITSTNTVFQDIEKLTLNFSNENIKNGIKNEVFLLSSDIEFLFNNISIFPDIDMIRNKYTCMLYDKGYSSASGLINQVKLHEEFLRYYSTGFLIKLQSNIRIEDENSWIRIITRKKQKTVHPIRHLIFIRFLFGSLNNFLEYSKITIPKPTLKKLEVSNKSNCYRAYLEVPYKKAITELIKNEPHLSRRQIKQRLSNQYRWLYTHERDWLEKILPDAKKHKEFYKNDRVDWKQRDIEMYNKIKIAIYKILNDTKVNRVTVTYIAQIIGYKALGRNLEKLPKSNKLIEENIEKLDDFHRRKIKNIIKQLVAEDNDLKRYVILAKACIPRKYYNCYDYYIESTIEEETKNKE